MRARKHRAENRSVYDIHEDSSTELTPLSRKKCIFRDALYFVQRNSVVVILLSGGDKTSQKSDIVKAKKIAAQLEV